MWICPVKVFARRDEPSRSVSINHHCHHPLRTLSTFLGIFFSLSELILIWFCLVYERPSLSGPFQHLMPCREGCACVDNPQGRVCWSSLITITVVCSWLTVVTSCCPSRHLPCHNHLHHHHHHSHEHGRTFFDVSFFKLYYPSELTIAIENWINEASTIEVGVFLCPFLYGIKWCKLK